MGARDEELIIGKRPLFPQMITSIEEFNFKKKLIARLSGRLRFIYLKVDGFYSVLQTKYKLANTQKVDDFNAKYYKFAAKDKLFAQRKLELPGL